MGSYTGRDLNSLNCYINRKFKGLCGAVKAEKQPCASGSPRGLLQQPTLSQVFFFLGGGSLLSRQKWTAQAHAHTAHAHCSSCLPLPAWRTQVVWEPLLAAVPWKSWAGLFLAAKGRELEKTQCAFGNLEMAALPWPGCGAPAGTFLCRFNISQGFSFSTSMCFIFFFPLWSSSGKLPICLFLFW